MKSTDLVALVVCLLVLVALFVVFMVWLFVKPGRNLDSNVMVLKTRQLSRPAQENQTEPAWDPAIQFPAFRLLQVVRGDQEHPCPSHFAFEPSTNLGVMVAAEGEQLEAVQCFQMAGTPPQVQCTEEVTLPTLRFRPSTVLPRHVVMGRCDTHEVFCLACESKRQSWVYVFGWTREEGWICTNVIRLPHDKIRALHLHRNVLVLQTLHHVVLYTIDNRGQAKRVTRRYEEDDILTTTFNGDRLALSVGTPMQGTKRAQTWVVNAKGRLQKQTRIPLYNFQRGEDSGLVRAIAKRAERMLVLTDEHFLLSYDRNVLTQILPAGYRTKQVKGSSELDFVVLLNETELDEGGEETPPFPLRGECRAVLMHEGMYDLQHSQLLWEYTGAEHELGDLVWFRDRYMLFVRERPSEDSQGCVSMYEWVW